MGKKRNACRVLMSNEGKRPLLRSRLSWEDIIKIDLETIRWVGVD
jgi:hypothetical protein